MTGVQFLESIPVLGVRDVEALARWYESMLGLTIVHLNKDPEGEEPTNYAVLRRQTAEVHLVLKAGGTQAFCLVVKGIDEIYSSLQAKKVTVKEEIADKEWGGRDFMIEDPDGNEIIVLEKIREY